MMTGGTPISGNLHMKVSINGGTPIACLGWKIYFITGDLGVPLLGNPNMVKEGCIAHGNLKLKCEEISQNLNLC